MADRTVLITGASLGIGRAAARAFLDAGDRVVALARGRERLEQLAAELGGPPRIEIFEADVTDAAGMERCAADVLRRCGVPDVVVANAGLGLDAGFVATTDAALRTVFDVNVFGVFRTIRPYLPQMLERGSGRLLLISSIVGKRGIPNYSAYSASKFALSGVADALRCELWGSGVTVGLICPASTTTGFHERALHDGKRQRRVRPRTHSPESVAAAIVRMAGSRRREVVLGLEAKLMVAADHLFPGLLDRILARMLREKPDA